MWSFTHSYYHTQHHLPVSNQHSHTAKASCSRAHWHALAEPGFTAWANNKQFNATYSLILVFIFCSIYSLRIHLYEGRCLDALMLMLSTGHTHTSRLTAEKPSCRTCVYMPYLRSIRCRLSTLTHNLCVCECVISYNSEAETQTSKQQLGGWLICVSTPLVLASII